MSYTTSTARALVLAMTPLALLVLVLAGALPAGAKPPLAMAGPAGASDRPGLDTHGSPVGPRLTVDRALIRRHEALGHLRPDDWAGTRGQSSRPTRPVANMSVRPDDRAGVRASGGPTADAAPNLGRVRPDDRAGLRGTGVVSAPIATPVVVHVTHSEFDWGDAGVGAAAGAGLVLLLFGASLLVRHARTEPRPA